MEDCTNGCFNKKAALMTRTERRLRMIDNKKTAVARPRLGAFMAVTFVQMPRQIFQDSILNPFVVIVSPIYTTLTLNLSPSKRLVVDDDVI